MQFQNMKLYLNIFLQYNKKLKSIRNISRTETINILENLMTCKNDL